MMLHCLFLTVPCVTSTRPVWNVSIVCMDCIATHTAISHDHTSQTLCQGCIWSDAYSMSEQALGKLLGGVCKDWHDCQQVPSWDHKPAGMITVQNCRQNSARIGRVLYTLRTPDVGTQPNPSSHAHSKVHVQQVEGTPTEAFEVDRSKGELRSRRSHTLREHGFNAVPSEALCVFQTVRSLPTISRMLSDQVITTLVSAALVSSGLLLNNFSREQPSKKRRRNAILFSILQAQHAALTADLFREHHVHREFWVFPR